MAQRLTRDRMDEIRESLRKLRAANPDMSRTEAREALIKLYDVEFGDSFNATYWNQSTPDGEEQVEDEVGNDEVSELFTLVGLTDGNMRFTADVICEPEIALAAARALSGAVSE